MCKCITLKQIEFRLWSAGELITFLVSTSSSIFRSTAVNLKTFKGKFITLALGNKSRVWQ